MKKLKKPIIDILRTGLLTLLFSGVLINSGQAQNETFMVLTEAKFLEVEEGTFSFDLAFEGVDTLDWTITCENEWLLIEPLNGTGSGTIWVSYPANTGIGRTGEIIVSAEGAVNSPDTLKVYQFNGLNPNSLVFRFEQNFMVSDQDSILDNTPSLTLTYKPYSTGIFFNVIAKTETITDSVWIVRNLYLPNLSWTPILQKITSAFDPEIMGLGVGDTLPSLEYAWNISDKPYTETPWVPENSWKPADVFMSSYAPWFGKNQNLAWDELEPEERNFYPPIEVPEGATRVVSIGCEMPNGNLNNSERPGERNACAPASAANSLHWLQGVHPQIQFPPNWRETFNQLSSLSGRRPDEGVMDTAFIRAKLDFIEMYNLPIKVKFQGKFLRNNISSTSGNSSAVCNLDTTIRGYPDSLWLMSEVDDGEDIELGLHIPGRGGHYVTLTGKYFQNGYYHISFKHDLFHTVADTNGLQQQSSRVGIGRTTGQMILPGFMNSVITTVVSESYDPDHDSVPSSVFYRQYCQTYRKTIAPNRKITIVFPDSPDRCFNTTLRVLDRGEGNHFVTEATWNFNKGKRREYINNTGHPVTIELHNDDYYDGGWYLKTDTSTYIPYTVDFIEGDSQAGEDTDQSNADEYGGFSIGTDDNSSDEFGNPIGAKVLFINGIGASLGDIPKTMGPSHVSDLTINHNVPVWNDYWADLDLIIGVNSVSVEGNLHIVSTITGLDTTVLINSAGDYIIPLGGMTTSGIFDLTLRTTENLSFTFDNIGVPSKVQMNPNQVDLLSDLMARAEIFPNPNNGVFSIKLISAISEKVNIEVFDLTGKSIFKKEREIISGESIEEINIGNNRKGIYYIRINIGESVINKKVVIK